VAAKGWISVKNQCCCTKCYRKTKIKKQHL